MFARLVEHGIRVLFWFGLAVLAASVFSVGNIILLDVRHALRCSLHLVCQVCVGLLAVYCFLAVPKLLSELMCETMLVCEMMVMCETMLICEMMLMWLHVFLVFMGPGVTQSLLFFSPLTCELCLKSFLPLSPSLLLLSLSLFLCLY